MRHQKKTIKLGRTADHRKALLANQVCSLIEHKRIKTTLAKAKAVRPLAERMVTLGQRKSDSAPMAFIEWVDMAEVGAEKPAEEKKAKRKEAEAKPTKAESETVTPKQEEPAAKEEKSAEAPAPAKEPQPKKRRWFSRKASEQE